MAAEEMDATLTGSKGRSWLLPPLELGSTSTEHKATKASAVWTTVLAAVHFTSSRSSAPDRSRGSTNKWSTLERGTLHLSTLERRRLSVTAARKAAEKVTIKNDVTAAYWEQGDEDMHSKLCSN